MNIPSPTQQSGLSALNAMRRSRTILSALTVFNEELGDIFQISLGAFKPVFMVGPDAARFVLVSARDQLLWRPEHDPVTKLLRNGLLVTDHDEHDRLRRIMNPSFRRTMIDGYVESMWRSADRIMLDWSLASGPVEMLTEMRRMALLIVMDTLFRIDMMRDLDHLVPVILDILRYISPGLWTVWPGAPRFGFQRSLDEMDGYLYKQIAQRRAAISGNSASDEDDLLTTMVRTPGMSDDVIRDQLITLLIAGHDTSTALLAWTLYLLGAHPDITERVQVEVDEVLKGEPPTVESVGKLHYMEQVLNETLRLYPPIHIGNRIAAEDLSYDGYEIPAGSRVVYSIYLTHRQHKNWPEPNRFDPERFSPEQKRKHVPYAFIPFGGGPRNCIGAGFALVEAKAVLGRILQRYELTLTDFNVHPHMGATLEPSPGVLMNVLQR